MKNMDINKIKLYIEENEKKTKMVIVVIAIGLSILFFWMKGNESEVNIQSEGENIENELDIQEEEYQDSFAESVPKYCYVDISGAVNNPGVYKVDNGTRLFEVIEMAGGLTTEADPNTLNRAEEVYDGQKVIVQTFGSGETYYADQSTYSTESANDGKVNINTADKETLKTLPGIGDVKADAIIAYRENVGGFKTIEEITNVNGIGDSTFSIIMELIKV